MDNAEKLYTPVEVAAILQISTRTVTRWLRDGTLTGIKTGPRLWRIPSSEVLRLIEGGRGPEEPPVVRTPEEAENLFDELLAQSGNGTGRRALSKAIKKIDEGGKER